MTVSQEPITDAEGTTCHHPVDGSGPDPAPDPSLTPERVEAALELIRRQERSLRWTARRVSLCEHDAEDAYQRAVEILITKAPACDPARLAAWMHTVTRREALALRRKRDRLLGPPPPGSATEKREDPLERLRCDGPGPAERAVRRERVAATARALAALKPQERRALGLRAEGFSYAEIMEITGWTYTKVNRCLAEGRATLRELQTG